MSEVQVTIAVKISQPDGSTFTVSESRQTHTSDNPRLFATATGNGLDQVGGTVRNAVIDRFGQL